MGRGTTSVRMQSITISNLSHAQKHHNQAHRATLKYVHHELTVTNERWDREYKANGNPKSLNNYYTAIKKNVKEKTGRAKTEGIAGGMVCEDRQGDPLRYPRTVSGFRPILVLGSLRALPILFPIVSFLAIFAIERATLRSDPRPATTATARPTYRSASPPIQGRAFLLRQLTMHTGRSERLEQEELG